MEVQVQVQVQAQGLGLAQPSTCSLFCAWAWVREVVVGAMHAWVEATYIPLQCLFRREACEKGSGARSLWRGRFFDGEGCAWTMQQLLNPAVPAIPILCSAARPGSRNNHLCILASLLVFWCGVFLLSWGGQQPPRRHSTQGREIRSYKTRGGGSHGEDLGGVQWLDRGRFWHALAPSSPANTCSSPAMINAKNGKREQPISLCEWANVVVQ